MNFVIAKNPINLFNFYSPYFHDRYRNPSILLHNSITKWTRGTKTLTFRATSASTSTIYGGWDELASSEASGEFDSLRSFLVSVGIDDRKNAFVFLMGIVCAMAISRVRVSTVLILPASAMVFAIGYSVGFLRNGNFWFGEVKVSGSGSSKRKEKDENFNSSEKLKSLGEFFDEIDVVVNDFKIDLENAIKNKKIKMDDLYGYVEVSDKIKLSSLNGRNYVKVLIDNEEKCNGVLVENHKGGRRKKQVGEAGYQMLQAIGNLFQENLRSSYSTKVRENVERQLDQTRGNGALPPVEDKHLNLVDDSSKLNGKLDSSQDSFRDSVLDMDRNGRIGTNSERENFGVGDNHRSAGESPERKEYSYRNKGLRFTNNHSISLKMDSSSVTDMWESHESRLDSESIKVRMKRVESETSFLREQLLNQGQETFRSSIDKRNSGPDRSRYEEDRDRMNYDADQLLADDLSESDNEFNAPSSTKVSDDIMFDRYLAEATDLLKQAKEFVKGTYDGEQAEIMLYNTASLLSKAVDLKPMSLLAVGQLGNTYLLHGELKLKISRELRNLLSGSIERSSAKRSRIIKELRNKITSKEEAMQLLIDVCEESEELLVNAGRKYRLALSIDSNDVRALYNWGLALSFRGQLIADIGPGAAFEAERVFLAAIDKFDAMLLKGNVYAPDALFRWGMALQQRSRLRPGSSKEKLKLLQQAKRLYEDALDMDSNNIQVKDALSLCVSELNYRQL